MYRFKTKEEPTLKMECGVHHCSFYKVSSAITRIGVKEIIMVGGRKEIGETNRTLSSI
jgi:hypothetical protein